MTSLISKFKLDSTKGSAQNIWLIALAMLFLMGLNFRALAMPKWIFISLVACISIWQIISLMAFVFWTWKLWRTWTGDRRLTGILYFVLLLLATFVTVDLAIRIIR